MNRACKIINYRKATNSYCSTFDMNNFIAKPAEVIIIHTKQFAAIYNVRHRLVFHYFFFFAMFSKNVFQRMFVAQKMFIMGVGKIHFVRVQTYTFPFT